MSDEIGEEGQHSRDGLSAPNSEPNSAVQSPHNDQDDEGDDDDEENGEREGDEGEGEEGDDGAQDGSESEEENGEDEAQDAQGGVEGGERPEATAEPQRQASSATTDQQASQPAKPAPAKENRARVRKWERKLVRIGHLQLLKWVPLEPREASHLERTEKGMLKRQISDNAPVTRSTTAAYHQRVRLEVRALLCIVSHARKRRAATRNVSYRDEDESADTRDDDEPTMGKRRREDD